MTVQNCLSSFLSISSHEFVKPASRGFSLFRRETLLVEVLCPRVQSHKFVNDTGEAVQKQRRGILRFHMATSEETTLDAAEIVKDLRRIHRSGRTRAATWRLEQLHSLSRLVAENQEEVAAALTSDLNKPPYEAFITEQNGVAESVKGAIKNLNKWMTPEKVPVSLSTWPGSAAIVPEPLGVALIVSPWNYPYLLALDPVIGAIAAGCCVVLKTSEVAPATSALLARLIPKYLDQDAVRVVEGGVPEITALLNQKWDKIFYTGSTKVGRIMMAAAAKHLTPVTLELGGKSPLYIDSTVDLKVSANRIAVGKWGSNNGQACIAPDFILVEESLAPKLVETLKKTLSAFYGEDPRTSKDLSRIVNKFHYQRLIDVLDDPSTAEKIVHGGERDEKLLYLAPTMVVNPPLDSPIMSEEIFGPLLPIITVKGLDEAIDIILSRPKPLALYLFTTNKEVQQKMIEETSAGTMAINECVLQFLVPSLPFGGVGESGTGSYHGKASFDAFSHKKSILTRGMGGDVFARYPPFTSTKQNIIKSVLAGDYIRLVLLVLGIRK